MKKLILNWIRENYGKEEAENPCYDINKLAKHIEGESLYMVIASYQNSIRNNLEIVDYNLTLDEAQDLETTLRLEQENNQVNEDWLIDDVNSRDGIRIVKQGERI